MADVVITMHWVGADRVVAKMTELEIGAPVVVGRKLYTRANLILTEIKDQDVPVDLGTLRDSGYVEGPFTEPPAGTRVNIGFGGAAKDYAHYQHEGMTWQSGYTKPLHYHGQGHDHYLTGPVQAHQDEIAADVRAAVLEQVASMEE
jgi:hypothetical protein